MYFHIFVSVFVSTIHSYKLRSVSKEYIHRLAFCKICTINSFSQIVILLKPSKTKFIHGTTLITEIDVGSIKVFCNGYLENDIGVS